MDNLNILEFTDNEASQALVTLAIGKKYLMDWEKYAFPTWKLYADRHNLKILVVTNPLVDESDPYWKKPQWQKLLIPDALPKYHPEITDICYLDTDILINPLAPNIFDNLHPERIGGVSLRTNLPFNREEVYKKLALLRKTYSDKSYPLDSALFISLEDLYKFHNFPVQKDELCTGVLLFNIKKFSKIMKNWFYTYPKGVESITNGGEQTHLNYHILSEGFFNQLDYKWQAIWSYELAWKYPFLFKSDFKNNPVAIECLKNLLFDNYFLHFASKWDEANLWNTSELGITAHDLSFNQEYLDLVDKPLSGKAIGYIIPNSNN